MTDRKMRCYLFLLITCHLTIVSPLNDLCGRNNSTDIHVIGLIPCTSKNDTREIPVDNCDGIDRIPIMKLALQEIDERCDLLPGYRLVVDYANPAVSAGRHACNLCIILYSCSYNACCMHTS